ncbi:MAG TPA: hypothetical protein VLF94_04635 [Chlamydiales bacterium]|nr:hypothetical protein [Chlamydiales bacterium]
MNETNYTTYVGLRLYSQSKDVTQYLERDRSAIAQELIEEKSRSWGCFGFLVPILLGSRIRSAVDKAFRDLIQAKYPGQNISKYTSKFRAYKQFLREPTTAYYDEKLRLIKLNTAPYQRLKSAGFEDSDIVRLSEQVEANPNDPLATRLGQVVKKLEKSVENFVSSKGQIPGYELKPEYLKEQVFEFAEKKLPIPKATIQSQFESVTEEYPEHSLIDQLVIFVQQLGFPTILSKAENLDPFIYSLHLLRKDGRILALSNRFLTDSIEFNYPEIGKKVLTISPRQQNGISVLTSDFLITQLESKLSEVDKKHLIELTHMDEIDSLKKPMIPDENLLKDLKKKCPKLHTYLATFLEPREIPGHLLKWYPKLFERQFRQLLSIPPRRPRPQAAPSHPSGPAVASPARAPNTRSRRSQPHAPIRPSSHAVTVIARQVQHRDTKSRIRTVGNQLEAIPEGGDYKSGAH